jgi:group I intron endonuclease
MPYAKQISGIYIITCIANNKHYIGKSVNCLHRIGQHKIALKENRHHSYHLQRSYNKYGLDNFLFDILEEHSNEFLNCMESYWIKLLDSTNRKYGFNVSNPNGQGGFEMKISTKEKLSASRKGKHLSDFTKEKLKKINLGKKLSDEVFNNLMEKGRLYRLTDKYKEFLLRRKEKVGIRTIIYNLFNNNWKKFNSISEAADYLKASDSSIHRCMNKQNTSTKNHLVFSEDKFDPSIKYTKTKRKNGRKKNKSKLGQI